MHFLETEYEARVTFEVRYDTVATTGALYLGCRTECRARDLVEICSKIPRVKEAYVVKVTTLEKRVRI